MKWVFDLSVTSTRYLRYSRHRDVKEENHMFTARRFILFGLILIVSLVLTLLGGTVAAQTNTACPAGQGYWKNTAAWPVTTLTLGSQTYSQAELLIILNTPVGGDASLNLAHQLIAAKLNAARGSDAGLASALIMQADALFSTFSGKLPYNVAPSDANGQAMVNVGGVLDSYNSGLLTVGCTATATPSPTPAAPSEATPDAEETPEVEETPEATPEGTPEPDDDGGVTIIIEGPVESININIITIYNINIELDENDPNLTIIQVGDTVRIEGDTRDNNGTIIIIAINIIIINVDINIDTGEIWRDAGDCLNGPPAWAPANGWRRRCGDNNNSGSSGGGDDGMGMGMGDDD